MTRASSRLPSLSSILALAAMPLLALSLAMPARAADEAPANRDPQQQIDEANGFFTLGRYPYAEKAYRDFLAAHPTHPLASEAQFFLAESLLAEHRPKEARAAYRELLAKFPHNPHAAYARYRIGETSYLLGDDAEAERVLGQWVAKHPADPLLEYALPYLGDILLREHKDRDAVQAYQKAIDRFPEGKFAGRCRLGMARALIGLGQTERATALLQRLVDAGGKLADQAALELGIIEFDAGRYDRAAETFKQLEQKFPASPLVPKAKLNRGLALYKQNQFAAARAVFDDLRRTAPPAVAAEAAYWLGLSFRATQQWARASEVLWAGFKKYPNVHNNPLAPDMLFYSAEAELKQDHYARAIDRFNLVGQRFPSSPLDPDSTYYASLAAYSDGQYAYALKLADYFAKYFPASPLIHRVSLLAGEAEIALKQYRPAIERLRGLLDAKLDPAVADAVRYNLARAYAADGQAEQARKTAESLADSGSRSAAAIDARYLLGTLEFNARRYAPAAKALESYLAAAPRGEWAAQALGYLARSLAEQAQWDRAESAAGRLRRADPGGQIAGPVLYLLGEAAYRAKQYDRAARWYAAAAAGPRSPVTVQALSGLGWSQYERKDYSAAAAAFARLVQQAPDDHLAPEALFMEGRAEEQARNQAEARRLFRAVMNRYPRSPEAAQAALQLARDLARSGRLADAAAAYAQLAEGFPAAVTAEVLSEWAFVFIDLKQVDKARAIFARLIHKFPQSPLVIQGRLNLAQADYDAHDYQKVIEDLKPLRDRPLDPQDQQAMLYNLGRAFAGLNDWTEVRSAFGRLARDFPQGDLAHEARFWMAEADYHQEKYAAAAERLERLTSEFTDAKTEPWLPEAWLDLAECRAQLKQWKPALAAVEHIEARFPGFRRSAEALYIKGRALQSDAEFDLARDAYRKAVADGGPATAAKAQFMIGETFFLQKQFERAEPELLKAYIDYPQVADWAAPALLEAGKCAEQLGHPDEAIKTDELLLTKYGQTRFAAEARQRLQALGKKPAPGGGRQGP